MTLKHIWSDAKKTRAVATDRQKVADIFFQ